MKALSIRQPWAWAIIEAGKDVENRDWSVRYQGYADARRLAQEARARDGGRFLIHASAGMTNAEFDEFFDFMAKSLPSGLPMPSRRLLPRGGIVGSAQLCDVVTNHPSPWFFGPVGLVLRDVKKLPFMPCKGTLGFFNVPKDVLSNAA